MLAHPTHERLIALGLPATALAGWDLHPQANISLA